MSDELCDHLLRARQHADGQLINTLQEVSLEGSSQAKALLGLGHLHSNQEDKAIKALEDALASNTQGDAWLVDACCVGLALCAPNGNAADECIARRETQTPNLAIFAAAVAARLKAREFESGLAACEEGLKSFPESLELCNARGLCLHALGQTTQAAEQFQMVLSQDMTQIDTVNNYAVLLMQQQYFKHAVNLLEQITEINPSMPHIWNNLGIGYKNSGRIQEASDAFAQASRICAAAEEHPCALTVEQNATGCYSPGYSLVRELAPRECCQRLLSHTNRLLEASRRDPRNAAVLDSQGCACRWLSVASEDSKHKQVYKAQARLCFAKSLEIAPAGWVPALQLALLAADDGDYAGAQQFLRGCIEANPSSFAAWNNLGIMLMILQQTADAELVLAKALEFAPKSHCTWNNLGNLYRQQGKFAEAQNAYDRCLELKSDYAPAYNNLGLLYVSLGTVFYPNATSMFEVSHKIDPTLNCAKYNLTRLKGLLDVQDDGDYDLMEL